jgi:hypothetical protein
MVAKRGKKSTRGIKSLSAKKLSAKQAKGIKGGYQLGGSHGDKVYKDPKFGGT